jgi:hypothetical protein
MRRIKLIRLEALALTAGFFLGSCAPLPDVSPFATATRELASALRTSGDTAVTIVADEHDQQKAGELREAWDERDKAMHALVRYSDGLTAIVAGFDDAKANAIKLGDSIEQLAQTAGIITPGGEAAAGVAIDVGQLVVEQIAKVKAAKSLERALTDAQPVIDAVAGHLGRRLIRGRSGAEVSNDVTDLMVIYEAVDSKIETEELQATQSTHDLITVLAARRSSIQARIPQGEAATVAEVAQLTQTIADANVTLTALQAPFRQRARRVSEAQALVEALAGAVDSWATAHADLANAIQQRRAVSVASLTDSALEIRALTKRIRDL